MKACSAERERESLVHICIYKIYIYIYTTVYMIYVDIAGFFGCENEWERERMRERERFGIGKWKNGKKSLKLKATPEWNEYMSRFLSLAIFLSFFLHSFFFFFWLEYNWDSFFHFLVLNILFKSKFKTSFEYLILTFKKKKLFWPLNFIKCLFFFPKLLENFTFSFLFLSL